MARIVVGACFSDFSVYLLMIDIHINIVVYEFCGDLDPTKEIVFLVRFVLVGYHILANLILACWTLEFFIS